MKKRIIGIISIMAIAAISMVSLSACTPALTDWEYIEDQGKMVIGYTSYAPLANVDADGTLVDGYDVELAKAVGEELGIEVEFKLIKWNNKIVDLKSKNIDVIWNGMTITDDLQASINITDPYLTNSQAVVVPIANADCTAEDLVGKKIGVESGSAGDLIAEEMFSTSTIVGKAAQVDVFTELLAGTVSAGVVDSLLAAELLAGDSFKGKFVVADSFSFEKESFGIGFRQDDDVFMGKVEDALATLKADGTMEDIATKYGVQDLIPA